MKIGLLRFWYGLLICCVCKPAVAQSVPFFSRWRHFTDVYAEMYMTVVLPNPVRIWSYDDEGFSRVSTGVRPASGWGGEMLNALQHQISSERIYSLRDRVADSELLQQYHARIRLRNVLLGCTLVLVLVAGWLLYNTRKKLHRRQRYFNDTVEQLEQEKADALREREEERVNKEEALLARQQEEEERNVLQQEMDATQRELTAISLFLQEKNKLLEELRRQLDLVIPQAEEGQQLNLKKVQQNIRHSVGIDSDWERIKLHFEKVHPGFFTHMKTLCPQLTPNELKHCAYIKMNLSIKETASLLNIDYNSVKMSRYRIKKKLDMDAADDLINYIQQI